MSLEPNLWGDCMNINLSDLRYYIFSGEGTTEDYLDIYNDTYRLWKEVWTQTLVDLKHPQKLQSDGFTRQTKIGALFYQNKCVALSAFRDVDFTCLPQREDSLLKSWSPEAFDILTQDGPRVCIASYLTVAPDLRGTIAPDITLKLLIVSLCTKYLLESDCDVMTGTMRCNRGTEKSAYASGARFIQKSQMYGVDVDLVGFFKKEIQQLPPSQYTHLWSEVLWKNKIELPQVEVANVRTKKWA